MTTIPPPSPDDLKVDLETQYDKLSKNKDPLPVEAPMFAILRRARFAEERIAELEQRLEAAQARIAELEASS